MLTDEQVRDLLRRAGDTITVVPRPTVFVSRSPRWRNGVVAAAVAAVIGIAITTQLASPGTDRSAVTPPLPTAAPEPSANSPAKPDADSSCEPGLNAKTDQGGTAVPPGPAIPTNASGQTYGSDGGAATSSPDLVAVVGSCGHQGYVRADELEDPAPWAPDAGEPAGASRTIAVYESDGLTQIDTFDIGGATGSSASGPSNSPAGSNSSVLQGDWTVRIAGVTREDGSSQYDTYRDLELRATVRDTTITLFDGCEETSAQFELINGDFRLTEPFEQDSRGPSTCTRRAPLGDILANVAHINRAKSETYMNLANFRIVLMLNPA